MVASRSRCRRQGVTGGSSMGMRGMGIMGEIGRMANQMVGKG